MKIILFACFFILFFLKASADNKYTEYARYQNTNKKDKIAFSDDEQTVILYSTNDSIIYFYRSYDMKPVYSAQCLGAPTYLQAFTNSAQGNALLFATKDGEILLRNFTAQESQVQIKLQTIADCNILKASPSPDKTIFATSCIGATQLLISSLLMGQDNIEKIEMNFIVQAFRWHPIQNKIAVAGTSNDNGLTYHLVIYDVDKKQQTEYLNGLENKIKDLEFSIDGQYLAFIIEGLTNLQYVTIFNIADPTKITNLVANDATQLFQLKRNGKLLTSYDAQKSYAWEFNNENYGYYNSIFKSPALSTTGGAIFTLDPLSREIVVNKICSQLNQVFINDQLQCVPCAAPCNTCFVKQNQCLSCLDNFYFVEIQYGCKDCLQNCKVCENAQTCKACQNGFYLDGNSCKSCAGISIGCITCDSQTCSKCDQSQNWVLNANNLCQCKTSYIRVENQCILCPIHCSVCKKTDSCQVCNAAEHRKPAPVDGKCTCDFGYFENIQDICQTCILGCKICDNSITCSQCDATSHWMLVKDNFTCTCQSGYLQISNKCRSCGDLMVGCSQCLDEHNCTACIDGYDLNTETNHCDKHPQDDNSPSVVIIIVIAVGVLIALGLIGFFIIRVIRKRKGKKVQTLLESEAEHQHQELQ